MKMAAQRAERSYGVKRIFVGVDVHCLHLPGGRFFIPSLHCLSCNFFSLPTTFLYGDAVPGQDTGVKQSSSCMSKPR